MGHGGAAEAAHRIFQERAKQEAARRQRMRDIIASILPGTEGAGP